MIGLLLDLKDLTNHKTPVANHSGGYLMFTDKELNHLDLDLLHLKELLNETEGKREVQTVGV
jgi:hypothetical protein